MLRWLRFILCITSVMLCSCVLSTHERALDLAREFEAVVELPGVVYQKGNRYYAVGVCTLVRRSERDVLECPILAGAGLELKPERSGVYSIVSGAPVTKVYREFRLKWVKNPMAASNYVYEFGMSSTSPPDENWPTWKGDGRDYLRQGYRPYYNARGEHVAMYVLAVHDRLNHDVIGEWQESLPTGARLHPACVVEVDNHPFMQGKSVGVYPSERSEARVNGWRACYAWPLAACCWLGADVPATIAMHVAAAPLLLYIYISE